MLAEQGTLSLSLSLSSLSLQACIIFFVFFVSFPTYGSTLTTCTLDPTPVATFPLGSDRLYSFLFLHRTVLTSFHFFHC
jgi:hypothetical protein